MGRFVEEADETQKARQMIIEILNANGYEVLEEVELETVTNNMGEKIEPPYQADIIAVKMFIIELDPQSEKKGKSKGHGTKIKISKDKWRDRNIYNQLRLKTVRLIPKNILKYGALLAWEEITSQLKRIQSVG